ncbi:MAG: hypothetical protein LBO21_04740, partial [Synergistaceae bacterium]|nr:hypothetical protein [Synergistaceae bacterium]
MIRSGILLWRRTVASFSLAMFLWGLSVPVGGAALAADDSGNVNIRAVLKADVAMEESDLEGEKSKSNVLFMIDSTIPMSFTPKSVMPTVVLAHTWTETEGESANWPATKSVYGHEITDVINMMAGSTYGMGALPTAWHKGNVTMERNLYGRERDAGNNFISTGSVEGDIEENKNRYYFPFTAKYPNRVTALKGAYQNQIDPLLMSYDTSTSKKAEFSFPGNAKHPPEYTSGSSLYDLQVSSSNWNVWKGDGRNTDAAHDDAYNGYPNVAYGQGDNNEYKKAAASGNAFPYALVFKNPAWWKSGPPSSTPADEIEKQLVPNDSRMYQTKLVLWNLLENKGLFENLRFGLATTFLSPINFSGEVTDYSPQHHSGKNNPGRGLTDRLDFHGVFKVEPFGRSWLRKSASNESRGEFKEGTSIQAVSGHVRGFTALQGVYYPMWGLQTVETNYSNLRTSNRSTADKNEAELVYRMEHRGSLWLPIRDYNAVWKKADTTMVHADRFRQWIDGLADIASFSTVGRNKQFQFYKEPEIGVAGVGLLPMAIYPDPRPGLTMSRKDYKKAELRFGTKRRDGGIFYSYKDVNRDWDLNYFMGSTELENPELDTRMRTNAGSGEAAGSIFDFFSPPAGMTSVAGTDISKLADVSYAVRNVNESNWVILITSGQEVKPEGDGYAYTAADAIKCLYDATDVTRSKDERAGYEAVMDHSKIYAEYEQVMEMPRRSDDTKLCEPRVRDLKYPIKTLVVGIVADPKKFPDGSTERRNTQEMRENVTKMAKAGQPDNPYARPFFADNVESLTIAIGDALQTIEEARPHQSGKGSVLVTAIDDTQMSRGDDYEEGEFSHSLYSGTYRIRYNNQWEGQLERYDIKQNNDGDMIFDERWDLASVLSGDASSLPPQPGMRGARKLRYWVGSNGPSGAFLPPSRDHSVWKWFGLQPDDGRIGSPGAGNLKNYADFAEPLMDWFQGWDYSIFDNGDDGYDDLRFARGSMMAELPANGVVLVSRPNVVDSLPGYEEWAKSVSGDSGVAPKIYVHTNDGVLHVVDPKNGDEEMAILPPPVILPSRLATLKTNVVVPDPPPQPKLKWINNTTQEGGSGALRSNPVYLLDGSLQIRRFDMGGKWGTYLIGALGKGGKGLYMMDVTNHGSPSFMWYREKDSTKREPQTQAYVLSMDKLSDYPELVPASGLDGDTDGKFSKLGFNSPKPVLGVTSNMQNFIIMAGGADLSGNGEGAVILVIDPSSGKVLRAFDGNSLEPAASVGTGVGGDRPYMGMMITEPAPHLSDKDPYLTGQVFAADNRGNIFRISFEKGSTPLAVNGWKIETVATLQTSNPGEAVNFANPHGMALAKVDSRVWVAGGTADLQLTKATEGDSGWLNNKSQLIFAFKPDATDSNGNPIMPLVRYGSEWVEVAKNNDSQASSDSNGWYIGLDTQAGREYVTTKPVIVSGVLFVATYIEEKIKVTGKEAECVEDGELIRGNSRLYAVNVTNGSSANIWNGGGKYLSVDNAKITGLTLTKIENRMNCDEVALLVSFDPNGVMPSFDDQNNVWYAKTSDSLAGSGGGGPPGIAPLNLFGVWVRSSKGKREPNLK